MIDRLAAELRHLDGIRTDLSENMLISARAALNQRRALTARQISVDDLVIIDSVVRVDTHRSIGVRMYRRDIRPDCEPLVIYCHSGAFVLGNLDTDHRQCVEIARNARCTVVAVDYRLAPEHPYPAALEDIRVVLRWLVAAAGELRVDTRRIAVVGNSAGGALAACIAQESAAGQLPTIIFELLHQPALDDRRTPSKEEFTATPGFDGMAAAQMWRYYLAGNHRSPGAVPAAAVHLGGIAPTMITCSELDPLRDEAVDYARRLMWAAVPTELHVFSGTCHGFDTLVPDAVRSGRLREMHCAALAEALHG